METGVHQDSTLDEESPAVAERGRNRSMLAQLISPYSYGLYGYGWQVG